MIEKDVQVFAVYRGRGFQAEPHLWEILRYGLVYVLWHMHRAVYRSARQFRRIIPLQQIQPMQSFCRGRGLRHCRSIADTPWSRFLRA